MQIGATGDFASLETGGQFDTAEGRCLHAALTEALAGEHALPQGLRQIAGMSGQAYRVLINRLVRRLSDARYLEVGSWKGSTACAAMYGNAARITCIEDWSEFGGPRAEFLRNVESCLNPEIDFQFIECDFREADFAALGRHNIYLFDGPHGIEDQIEGIALAQPALEDTYCLIVDDWNWPTVRQGTRQALARTGCVAQCFVDLRTTDDGTHPPHEQASQNSAWHNGYLLAVVSKCAPETVAQRPGGIP